MAIPIKDYINVGAQVASNVVGDRDFSGLLFVTDSMKATVPAAYASVKTDYVAGKAVALDYNGIVACFDSDAKVLKFAKNYFGYVANGANPQFLNVASYTNNGDEVTRLNAVLGSFTNFGSLAFLGSSAADLADVAPIAAANGVALFVATVAGTYPATFTGDNVHIVIGEMENVDPDDTSTDSMDNYAPWMPMSWYAAVNYNNRNASSTINYKTFEGAKATITDATAKAAADTAKANYIGEVQVYGQNLKFYQKGINASGMELGVYRDMVWLKSRVEIGWFNLVGSMPKVPANTDGASYVYAMVNEAANEATQNGVILVDKPLSAEARAKILQYAGNADAIDDVQTQGYYIAVNIVKSGTDYVCQYLLVYAKGDSISKVEGTHVLV